MSETSAPDAGGQRVRVLLHGAGADVDAVARQLRDAGHEVVRLDGALGVEALAQVALQEDVDEVVVADEEPLAALRALLDDADADEVGVRLAGAPARGTATERP